MMINLVERLNPVWLRSLRQSVRARDFNLIFYCLLVGGLILALFALQSPYPGQIIATTIGITLAILFLVILPLRAAMTILSESKSQVQDLVMITNLKPLKVITGQIWSTMTIGTVSAAALAPFIATAYFLGGVPFDIALICIVGPILAGPLMISFALALTTGIESRLIQFFALLIILAGDFYVFAGAIALTREIFYYSPMSAMAWYTFLSQLVFYPLLFINFLLIARSRLLPPMADRSLAVKFSWFITFLVYIIDMIVFLQVFKAYNSGFSSPDFYFPALYTILIFAQLLTFFFITEAPCTSRRVLLHRHRHPIKKLYLLFFSSGAGRGVIYSFLCLSLAVVVNHLFFTPDNLTGRYVTQIYHFYLILYPYTFFFLGVPVAVLNCFTRFQITPLMKRIVSALFFLFVILVSGLVGILTPSHDSIIWVLNPFVMSDMIFFNRITHAQVVALVLMGILGLLAFIFILINSNLQEKALQKKLLLKKKQSDKAAS